jgi:hypothetical protein
MDHGSCFEICCILPFDLLFSIFVADIPRFYASRFWLTRRFRGRGSAMDGGSNHCPWDQALPAIMISTKHSFFKTGHHPLFRCRIPTGAG